MKLRITLFDQPNCLGNILLDETVEYEPQIEMFPPVAVAPMTKSIRATVSHDKHDIFEIDKDWIGIMPGAPICS